MGSGLVVDSVVINTGKGRDEKVIFHRILCGACNGSGTQIEDSYLDNMILYARGAIFNNTGSDEEIPDIISMKINAIQRRDEELVGGM